MRPKTGGLKSALLAIAIFLSLSITGCASDRINIGDGLVFGIDTSAVRNTLATNPTLLRAIRLVRRAACASMTGADLSVVCDSKVVVQWLRVKELKLIEAEKDGLAIDESDEALVGALSGFADAWLEQAVDEAEVVTEAPAT